MRLTKFFALCATVVAVGPVLLVAQAPKPASVMLCDVAGDGLILSSVEKGVLFDLEGTGSPRQTAWTLAGSDDSLLALDLNGNGQIDSGKELVGSRLALDGGVAAGSGANALQFPLQGFALGPDSRPIAPPQRPFPPGIGFIDKDDAIFSKLRLWTDLDHNGRTEQGELKSLTQHGIAQIDLAFRSYGGSQAAPADEHGNRRVILGKFQVSQRGMLFPHDLAEVVLAK
jgi:hypothetical protein